MKGETNGKLQSSIATPPVSKSATKQSTKSKPATKKPTTKATTTTSEMNESVITTKMRVKKNVIVKNAPPDRKVAKTKSFKALKDLR